MARTFQTTVSGVPVMVHLPSWHSADASGLRPILVGHGHGGHEYQMAQGDAMSFAGHPEYLADQGYAVGCAYTGDTWLNSTAMSAITALYGYLVTTLGASAKAGLLGWSMGAGMLLRWAVENPTLVAAGYFFAGLTDMDSRRAANSGWATEMDAAYSNNYAGLGSPRSPLNTAASFRGLAPMRFAHPTDDATVPITETQAFITAVNDPDVTMRQGSITGGHQAAQVNVPPREVWEFLRTSWAV